MGFDVYIYLALLVVLLIKGALYLWDNYHCKKCGSWSSEVRSHFEMNAQIPHHLRAVRYCSACDSEIITVATTEIREIIDNSEEES